MGKWSDWVDLGGAIISAPSAASRVKERMMVVARGTENEIVCRSYEDGSGWGDWDSLGGRSTYDPAILAGSPDYYTVYHVGGGQIIWRKSYVDGSGWEKGWTKTNESTEAWAGLAAVSSRDHRLDLFTLSSSNQVLHATCPPATHRWEPFNAIGSTIQGAVAAASWNTSRVDLVARGARTNTLWHRVCHGSTWSKWHDIGSGFISSPAVTTWGPDRLDVFAKGWDHQVLHRSWNGEAWSEWDNLGIHNTDDHLAAVSRMPGNIELFGRGRDNKLWHCTYTAEAGELDSGGVDPVN
ncbi:hypothetical protein ACIP4U_08755 [Streptomyces caelestis]|jgi:hypothetical protein|uniref:PLL-like beta propeller domain-containing protein n=1 Tax=Streptomyces caelestis TaxID=36816 RepID=A0A7W9H4X7_9ACTN|nr:hypothetical protein [Streptomyces caelestis]MBB5795473.1 hypothetical protein [Streptomyces caelestis]GGW60265.1 hypothetical protein GCM10010320_46510 [Streptomyces caelestis]